MPTTCSAVRCRNRYSSAIRRSFFRFPLRDAALTQKWIVAMKRKNWEPSKYSSICSDHFEERYFRYNNDRRGLMPNAVPSLFGNSGHQSVAVPVPKTKVFDPMPEQCILQEQGGSKPNRIEVQPLPLVNGISIKIEPVNQEEIQNEVSDSSKPSIVHTVLHDHEGYHMPLPWRVHQLYVLEKYKSAKLRRSLKLARLHAKRQRSKLEIPSVRLGLQHEELNSILTPTISTNSCYQFLQRLKEISGTSNQTSVVMKNHEFGDEENEDLENRVEKEHKESKKNPLPPSGDHKSPPATEEIVLPMKVSGQLTKIGLIGSTPTMTHKKRSLKEAMKLRRDGGPHWPKKLENKRAVVCHLKGCFRRTQYLCKRCKEPLCPECFEDFHS